MLEVHRHCMILLTPYLILYATTCSSAPTIPGVFPLAIPLTCTHFRAFEPTVHFAQNTLSTNINMADAFTAFRFLFKKTHDHKGIPDHVPQVAIPTLLLNSITCFVVIPTVSHLIKYSFYDCAYLPSIFHYKSKHENRDFVLFIAVFLAPRTVPSTQ